MRPRPAIAALAALLAALAAAPPALAPRARAADGDRLRIYCFDPTVNLKNLTYLEAKVQKALSKYAPGLTFKAFARIEELRKAAETDAPELAMCPTYHLSELPGGAARWKALLCPERDRSSFYRRVVVGRATFSGLEDLKGKSFATVGMGDNGSRFLDGVLFRGVPIRATDLRVIFVKKDLDALIAVGMKRCEAASVIPSAIDLLKAVNPGAVKELKVLHTSADIPLTPLWARADIEAERTAAVVKTFRRLEEDADGREALQLLNCDRLVPVTDELRERLR